MTVSTSPVKHTSNCCWLMCSLQPFPPSSIPDRSAGSIKFSVLSALGILALSTVLPIELNRSQKTAARPYRSITGPPQISQAPSLCLGNALFEWMSLAKMHAQCKCKPATRLKLGHRVLLLVKGGVISHLRYNSHLKSQIPPFSGSQQETQDQITLLPGSAMADRPHNAAHETHQSSRLTKQCRWME